MTAAPDRRARQHVAFQLSQVGAHVAERFGERCREIGLSPSEAAVLRLVGRTPGLSQRSLADRAGNAPSRIVALIDGLQARGLVARTRSRDDRRNYELQLTADGEALLVALTQIAQAHESEILEGLTREQTDHLADALQTLVRLRGLDLEVHHRTGSRADETDLSRSPRA